MPTVPGSEDQAKKQLSQMNRAPASPNDGPVLSFERKNAPPELSQPETDGPVLSFEQPDDRTLRAAQMVSETAPPDRAARILRLSQKVGLPSLFVEQNLEEIEKRAEASDFNPEEFRRTSPKLAEWIKANPHHFAYAKEDLSFLQKLERSAKAIGEGWEKARLQDELAEVLYKEMSGETLTPKEAGRRDEIKRRMDEIGIEEERSGLLSTEGVPRAGAYTVGQFVTSLPDVARGTLAGAALGAPFGGVGAVPGAVGGARIGAGYHTYRLESALTWDEFREMKDLDGKPMDPEVAKAAAMGVGLVNAAIEVGTFGPMLRLIPGFERLGKRAVTETMKKAIQNPAVRGPLVTAARKMATAGFLEGSEEFLQAIAQVLGREAAQAASGQTFDEDSLAEDIQGALNEAAHAFVGTTVTFGLGTGTASYFQRRRQIQQAKQNEQTLDELASAERSKAAEAFPEKREEAVASVLKDTASENQYVPAEAFAQYYQERGVDPAQAAREILGESGPKALQQAIETGTDIKIPTARYDATIARVPEAHEFFKKQVKPDPEALSVAEAEQLEAQMEQEAQSAQTKAEAVPATSDKAMAEVRSQIDAALEPTLYDEKTRKAFAQSIEARYQALAEDLGITVPEALARFPLPQIQRVESITSEGVTPIPGAPEVPTYDPLDTLISRIRDEDLPDERAARGQSLTEFLRERGGIRDDLGDLAAMEPDAERVPFRRNLIQPEGRALDEAAALAAESGYITEADPRALLDAIDRELRGEPVFSAMNADQNLVGQIEELSRLRSQIQSLGIDLQTMDNAEVRRRLRENEGVRADVGFDLFQSTNLLFHGSPEENLSEIRDEGLFGGIFASSRYDAARSHGEFVYRVKIEPSEIATTYDLREHTDVALDVARSETRTGTSDEIIEKIAEAAIEDVGADWSGFDDGEVLRALFSEDLGEASWKLQRIRGQIAKRLGYRAVEVEDEHGSSYLVLPGAKIERAISEDQLFYQSPAPTAPAFYSKMTRTIEEKMGNSATVEQVRAIIRDIKDEERKWSGIDEFLKGKEKVSKEELLAFLAANQLEVQEVTKGEVITQDRREQKAQEMFGESFAELPSENKRRVDDAIRDETGTIKFSQYTLPGGENYREVLFTLPGNEFRSGHWDESGVIAHVRLKDRETVDGKRVLFVEEIQSDLHQAGRKRGYRGDEDLPSGFRIIEDETSKSARWQVRDPENRIAGYGTTREAAIADLEKVGLKRVPQAPFKKTWHEFVLKRVIRMAAEGGYDAVAWTTGEQQAERYDLSKQVDTVRWSPETKELVAFKDGSQILSRDGVEASDLSEFIGKEAAEKLTASPKKSESHEVEGFRLGSPEFHELSGEDLKIGGEGMKGFYDKILVDFANKFGKKYGAKVEAGHVMTLDGTAPAHSLPLTPALQNAALTEGFPLFQSSRGMYRVTPEGKFIYLAQNANLSTLHHELSHDWFGQERAVLNELKARDPSTLTERQKKKLEGEKALLKWFGVESLDSLETKHHEQFARGYEAYLLEGKAPSSALREVFQTFRAWLIGIYRNILGISQEAGQRIVLNPEIREVYDRLLATEEAIAEAQAQSEDISFPGEPESLTRAKQEAIRAAEEELGAKMMEQEQRKRTKAYEEEWDRMAAEVAREVDARPVYQALFRLQGRGEGSIKLSRKAIVDQFGEARLRRLPRPYVYTRADTGLHPDIVASQFGFSSGDELLFALETAPNRNEEIIRLTDERMKALHGDMLTDGTLPVEAMKALHNEKRTELHMKRLEFLWEKRRGQFKEGVRRVTVRRLPKVQAIRDRAENIIRETSIREIRPNIYKAAERRAQRKALDAYLAGDFEQAYASQLSVLMNHELFRAASQAQERVEKGITKARRLGSGRNRMKIGKAGQDFLEQYDAIMAQYSFQTLATFQRKQSLLEFAKSVKENAGIEPSLSPVVLDTRPRHYTELTFEEFQGVVDTLSSIAQVAKRMNEIQGEAKRIQFERAALEFSERITDAKVSEQKLRETKAAMSVSEQLGDWWSQARALRRRPEFLMEMLDGDISGKGPAHEYLWNRSVDAQIKKNDLQKLVFDDIKKDVVQITEHSERMTEKIYLRSLGISLERRTIFGAMLNIGNESNKRKLMEGGKRVQDEIVPITEAAIEEMKQTLNEKEWQLIQRIFDSIDKLFPELDALNRRVHGIPLEKIEATPITTPYGEIRGGYWPAVADPLDTDVQRELKSEDDFLASELFPQRSPLAAVQGQRKERTGKTYPLDLNWAHVLRRHIDKATTDIAYTEFYSDATRLLKQPDVKNAILSRHGEAVYRSLFAWLKDQVAGIPRDPNAAAWMRAQNLVQQNTTVAALGFHYMNMIGSFVTAPIQALGRTGLVSVPKMAKNFSRYVFDYDRMYDDMVKLSGEMRHRTDNLDQMIQIVTSDLEGKTDFRSTMIRNAMQLHVWQEKTTGTVIWNTAYEQALERGESQEDAIRTADKAVRTTQMTGAIKDRSSLERSEMFRVMTMFMGPLIVLEQNFSTQLAIAKNKGGWSGVGKKAGSLMMQYTMLVALPIIVFELTQGRWPDDDDDPEEWAKWLAVKWMFALPSMIPVVNVPTQMLENKILGKHVFSSSHPVLQAGEAIAKFATTLAKSVDKALEGGDVDGWKIMKDALRALGPATGMPTGQILREGRGLIEGAGTGIIGRGAGALLGPGEVRATENPLAPPPRFRDVNRSPQSVPRAAALLPDEPVRPRGFRMRDGSIVPFTPPEDQTLPRRDAQEISDALDSLERRVGDDPSFPTFVESVYQVLISEGGGKFTHDQKRGDPPTKWGVTPIALADYRGVKTSQIKKEDIQALTARDAIEVYYSVFWKNSGISEIENPAFQIVVFNQAVHFGARSALARVRETARALGVKNLGPDTNKGRIELANRVRADSRFINKYLEISKEAQKKTISRNPQKRGYQRGWGNRLKKLRSWLESNPREVVRATPEKSGGSV